MTCLLAFGSGMALFMPEAIYVASDAKSHCQYREREKKRYGSVCSARRTEQGRNVDLRWATSAS